MKTKGYVFSGFVFLILMGCLALALFYHSSVSVAEDSSYKEIAMTKAHYIIGNIDSILQQMSAERGAPPGQVKLAIENYLKESWPDVKADAGGPNHLELCLEIGDDIKIDYGDKC
jgi:hypothetical protein